MASLIRKNIHGQLYYYARRSARVAGRPKVVQAWYLGRVDDLIAKCADPTVAPGMCLLRSYKNYSSVAY